MRLGLVVIGITQEREFVMIAYSYQLSSGHVFVTLQAEPRCDAWGEYRVTGALFDTVDGTVQTDAVAMCNVFGTVAATVAGVARGFGATVTAVLP